MDEVAKRGQAMNGKPVPPSFEVSLAEIAAHVKRGFPRFDHASCEDVAQTAFAELLNRQRKIERGEADPIDEPEVAWLKRCAWRRARDHIRDSREDACDPTDSVLVHTATSDPSPEEQVIADEQRARSIEALHRVEQDDRDAYLLSVREDLTVRALAKRLGCPKSTASDRRARAARAAHGELLGDEAWREGSLALALSVYAGTASSLERARFRFLQRFDTGFAQVAAEARRAQEGIAAAFPPVAVERATDPSVFERLATAPARIGERVLGGSDTTAAPSSVEPATAIAQSGAGRAAGAAGSGVLAKLGIGGAIGAKGIVACVGGGAATAACVAAGVVPGVGLSGDVRREAPEPPSAERAAPELLVDELPAPSPEPAETAPAEVAVEQSAPADAPAPVPEPPPAEREFGLPDSPAVTSDASTAAPSPTSSVDAGDPGTGAAAQEFGGP